jgi:hypothetical protein
MSLSLVLWFVMHARIEEYPPHKGPNDDVRAIRPNRKFRVARVIWNPAQLRAVLVLIETVGGGSKGSWFKQGKTVVECWAF